MAVRRILLPWDGQPQEALGINRANPLGAITDDLWVPTDLSGVALGRGTRTSAHADVRLATREGRVVWTNNDATEVGGGATIPALAFPWVLFAQFWVDAVPGFVATVPIQINGSGSNSYIYVGSSSFIGGNLRYNFGTQRSCDITVSGGTLGKLLSCVFAVRSETDYQIWCNGQTTTGTASPGTNSGQLTSLGSPLGTMNGAVALSGYARGNIDPDYALWLSKNPGAWLDLVEPRGLSVPVSAAGGGYTLTAAQGSFTLSGQAATILKSNVLTAEAGSLALNGQAATITYAPAGSYTLTAAAGAFTLSGQAATILKSKVVLVSAGAFSVSGQAATITWAPLGAYTLTAAAGAFTLAGKDATITHTATDTLGRSRLMRSLVSASVWAAPSRTRTRANFARAEGFTAPLPVPISAPVTPTTVPLSPPRPQPVHAAPQSVSAPTVTPLPPAPVEDPRVAVLERQVAALQKQVAALLSAVPAPPISADVLARGGLCVARTNRAIGATPGVGRALGSTTTTFWSHARGLTGRRAGV